MGRSARGRRAIAGLAPLLVAAALGAARTARAARLVTPADGAVVRASAVAVEVAVDGPEDAAALALRVNWTDVTARLRGAGAARTLVLAGVPGHGNVLRRGRNRVALEPGGARTTFVWRPRLARVRLVVVGNRLDFAAYESMATWRAEVDRIFERLVRPKLAAGRPNVVLLTEDFGLPAALVGTRGATTRAAKDADPLGALANLFAAYGPQASFYSSHFALPGSGLQPLARALVLALTDTLWRAFVPVLSAKAAALGVHLVACTNVAPAHRSTDPAEVAFFGDVDDPRRTDVFLPDGIDTYNTAFLWGPDGALLGTTHKVFLTPPERELLNLSPGALDDVRVFDTPAGRIGIAISLDAFTSAYVHRLDDLGATLVLQPDANPGLWATPGAFWQPDDWTGSVLGMLAPDLPNLTWNATSMMTGNFFPGALDATGVPAGIVFDGQSSITRRARRPPRRGFVAMARDLPFRGRFVALAPWAFPDPGTLGSTAALAALRHRCASAARAGETPRGLSLATRRALLYDCAKTLLPGGANAGAYRESVLATDLRLPVAGVRPAVVPDARPQRRSAITRSMHHEPASDPIP
jgi:hypothetical protein